MIYVVTMPEQFGGAPYGVFWDIEDAKKSAEEFYQRSTVMKAEKDRYYQQHNELPEIPRVYALTIGPMKDKFRREVWEHEDEQLRNDVQAFISGHMMN